MAELETIIAEVCEALTKAGLPNVTPAYPDGVRGRYLSPAVAVGLGAGCSVSSGGPEYLGMSFDAQSGSSVEVYGKKMELTLNVWVFSPRRAPFGAAGCAAVFGELAAALPYLPSGIRVKELRCGETVFDESAGMFRLDAEIRISAFFSAEATDDDEVLDFNLRGTVRYT